MSAATIESRAREHPIIIVPFRVGEAYISSAGALVDFVQDAPIINNAKPTLL